MPKLPDMSAAAVRRRQVLSEAPVKAVKAKAPPAKKAAAPARKRARKTA
jgi:hypothetical protein